MRVSSPRKVATRYSSTSEPYGPIDVTVALYPRTATLTAPALPPASLGHAHDRRTGRIPLDATTLLTVGGVQAVMKTPRAGHRLLAVELGDRRYTYVVSATGTEELRNADGEALVRTRFRIASPVLVTVLPIADDTDVALGLILLGADTNGLTLTRATIFGVLSFLDSGKGEA